MMSGMIGAHNELHSEQGALRDERHGRSPNPVIKVADIAWLEFEKPDLVRAEAFANAFGFTTVRRACGCAAVPGRDSSGRLSRPRTRSMCCGSRTSPGCLRRHCPNPSAACR